MAFWLAGSLGVWDFEIGITFPAALSFCSVGVVNRVCYMCCLSAVSVLVQGHAWNHVCSVG